MPDHGAVELGDEGQRVDDVTVAAQLVDEAGLHRAGSALDPREGVVVECRDLGVVGGLLASDGHVVTHAHSVRPDRRVKSVSGVLAAGPADIHRFAPGYEFCADCRTRTCVGRARRLADPRARKLTPEALENG